MIFLLSVLPKLGLVWADILNCGIIMHFYIQVITKIWEHDDIFTNLAQLGDKHKCTDGPS